MIEDYLKSHMIVGSRNTVPGYIGCEVIVDNPAELVSLVNGSECYISEIRWWEHAEIATGSNIGYGGPRDPQNPDTHYFAETDICMTFDSFSSENTYQEYLQKINSSYPMLDLHPAFDIKKLGDKGTVLPSPDENT